MIRCPVSAQIADRGVRALVKVLDSNNVVTFLNLQDNQVGTWHMRSLLDLAAKAVMALSCSKSGCSLQQKSCTDIRATYVRLLADAILAQHVNRGQHFFSPHYCYSHVTD